MNNKIATIAIAGILSLGVLSAAPAFACKGMSNCSKPQCAKKVENGTCKKGCKCTKCNKKQGCKGKARPDHSDNARYND